MPLPKLREFILIILQMLMLPGILLIGYPTPVISGSRSYGGEDTNIICNVVRGPVRDGSSTVVDVSRSANIRLR